MSLQSAAKSIRETSGYIFQTTLTDLFSFDALTPLCHFVLLKHYCELSRPCLPCQAVSGLNFSIGPSILFPASTNALLSHELFVWLSLLFSPLAGSHQHSFPPNKKKLCFNKLIQPRKWGSLLEKTKQFPVTSFLSDFYRHGSKKRVSATILSCRETLKTMATILWNCLFKKGEIKQLKIIK